MYDPPVVIGEPDLSCQVKLGVPVPVLEHVNIVLVPSRTSTVVGLMDAVGGARKKERKTYALIILPLAGC